jgi:hypothetical protein
MADFNILHHFECKISKKKVSCDKMRMFLAKLPTNDNKKGNWP